MKGFTNFMGHILANISFILLILGFISFIYAAFLLNLALGFVILGIILIYLAYILQPTEQIGVKNSGY